MSVTKRIKWQRALGQLRYNHEELGFIKQISKEYAVEFQAYYEQYCASRGVNISELNNQNRERVNTLYNIEKTIPSEEHEPESEVNSANDTDITLHKGSSRKGKEKEHQMTADETAMHEAFSKLFKRIALKIHPDRLQSNISIAERQTSINMFQKANKSFEDRKYYVLLDIATQLKISTPKNYSQQTRWMKKENVEIEHQIQHEKSTYNFIFSELESDEERDHLIRNFIRQVFQIHTE
jgi:phage anti-repressor protein